MLNFRSLVQNGRAKGASLKAFVNDPRRTARMLASRVAPTSGLMRLVFRVSDPKFSFSGLNLISSDKDFVRVGLQLSRKVQVSDFVKMFELALETYWSKFPVTSDCSFRFSDLNVKLIRRPAAELIGVFHFLNVEAEVLIQKLSMRGHHQHEFDFKIFDANHKLCAELNGSIEFSTGIALSSGHR